MLGGLRMILPISMALHAVAPDDEILINNERPWFTVCGVSKNFIIANHGSMYTIVQRFPTQYPTEDIPDGSYICGPDDTVFGYCGGYCFNDPDWVDEYLDDLETGTVQISMMHRAPIYDFHIKPSHRVVTTIPDALWKEEANL